MTHLWIGTSWKMNKTLAEAESFARALRDAVGQARDERADGPAALEALRALLGAEAARGGAAS